MKRRLAVSAILWVSLLGGASSLAATGGPTLRLLDRDPVVVRGLHFKPAERARVVLTAQGRHVRLVRATALGSFTARFAGIGATDPCSGLFVQALGARGTVAVLKIRPMCPPA
jgi:hypothetical protein